MIFVALALAILAESVWAWHLGRQGLALVLTGFEIAFCAAILLTSVLRRPS